MEKLESSDEKSDGMKMLQEIVDPGYVDFHSHPVDAAEHTKLKVRVELEMERRMRIQVLQG
jgi:regulation of enolase protein 1 (concanavalin A-like superfamily)